MTNPSSIMREFFRKQSTKVALAVTVTYSAVGWLLYARSMKMYFAMEDFFHIAWVQQEGFKGVVRSFYSGNEYGLYRPMTIQAYFYLCRLLFGLNPLGYHLVNMLSQIANGLLVFLLVIALTQNRWMAFMAGVIYLCRMSHFLGIYWVSGIQEVWLAFWYLISLLSFMRYTKTGGKSFFLISVTAFALALTCKESAVTLPFVLVACVLLFEERLTAKALTRQCGPFFVVLGCFLAAKLLSWKLPVGDLYEAGIGIWIVKNFLSYVIWQVNPVYLVFILIKLFAGINPYAFLLREDLLRQILGGSALFALVAVLSLRKKLKPMLKVREQDILTRVTVLGVLLFITSLIPALLLKNRTQHFYLFVPSIGYSISAAVILGRYFRRSRTVFLLVTCVMVALAGYRLIEKVPDGRTNLSAKEFLSDLNHILSRRTDITKVYIRNTDTRIYQVLWYGVAFSTFLDRPVAVVFDFQNSQPSDNNALTLFYDGQHLHENPYP